MLKGKMEKKGKMLSDNEKSAKMSVIEAMRKMAEGEMGSRLKGMKKVTVAAPSEEGLEEGLEKAKDLVEGMPELTEGEEELEEGMEVADSDDEDEEMDEATLDAKLQKLMAMKDKLKAKV